MLADSATVRQWGVRAGLWVPRTWPPACALGSHYPQIAVLETGGLMFLNSKIPAGKKIKAELVFEIPKGLDLAEMRLDVSK